MGKFNSGVGKLPSIVFKTIGQVEGGTITKLADKPSEKFDKPTWPVVIDGDKCLWVREDSAMGSAIDDATDKAGVEGVAVGGILKVKFTEEEDTGQPSPLKHYKATYEPPAASAAGADDGEEPF